MYRIFSVLNSRGLDLSYPDILKAEILSTIPRDKQDEYAIKWEEIETMLGSETFEELFFDLRAIFSQKRQSRGMIEEFQEYVRPQTSTPQEFIDKILDPYACAMDNIKKTNYQHGTLTKEINGIFKCLNQLDHERWIPPALYYFHENWRKPHLVLHFLNDLERLVISFMICRFPHISELIATVNY